MISYSNIRDELPLIRSAVLDLAAYLDEDNWDVEVFGDLVQFCSSAARDVRWDMLCCDVSPDGAAEKLEKLRERDNSAQLMLIADPTTSPLKYIRPNILASTLVLRPLSREELKARITEMYRQVYAVADNEQDDAFSFKGKDGMLRVSYRDILYFEARDKKLFLVTEKSEYAFYSTLESLADSLPEQFIRCHKSFIVNSRYITRVAISQGQIFVSDIELPLSRSYKQIVKETVL